MFMATQGFFLYKNKLYKQIDGIITGLPLGSTLANFSLGYLEENLLSTQNDVLPKLYLHYIDDIYAVFDNNVFCSQFLQLLNSLHKNIQFTVEKATVFGALNFLDVNIKLHSTGYDTCVWRKPTNTGLLLNFNASCSQTWKSAWASAAGVGDAPLDFQTWYKYSRYRLKSAMFGLFLLCFGLFFFR